MSLENSDGDLLMGRFTSRVAQEEVRGASADACLVEAARGGDASAFGHLYRRYAGLVHGVLLGKVGREEAEDLVQEVFLAAMRRISALRDPNSFGAWLSAIARNLANDHYRRLKPADPMLEDPPEAAGKNAPTLESDADTSERILTIIRGLPEAYSETLMLRLVEGMTGPEIAERTGLTPGSVRVNLCRGMRMLRERLDELGVHGSEREMG